VRRRRIVDILFLDAIHYGLFLGTVRFREVKKCLD
jgi:hypothetical protein